VSLALRYLRDAAGEVREAAEWYGARNPVLRSAFRLAIRKSVAAAVENPGRFRCVYGEFRRVLMKRFPYAIWFRWHEETVVIVTVIHCARDPDELQRRFRQRWSE